MRAIVTNGPAAAAARGHWLAWLLSAAALGAALVPGADPWTALLIVIANAQWARLAYGRRRAGDAEALRALIAESGRAAGDDLRALRAELMRVRGLVHDAAATLGDGFHGISERLRSENRVIAVLMARMLAEHSALHTRLSEELAQVSAASAGANDGIETLARALQFEDVVRQLLEHCDRQAAGIETFIDGLAGLLADPRPEQRQARLEQACESYLESSARCANDSQRHSTQTTMQAGKVELF